MAKKTKKCVFCERRIDIEEIRCPVCHQHQKGNMNYLIALGIVLVLHFLWIILPGNRFFSLKNIFSGNGGRGFHKESTENHFLSGFFEKDEENVNINDEWERLFEDDASSNIGEISSDPISILTDSIDKGSQKPTAVSGNSKKNKPLASSLFEDNPSLESILYGDFDFSVFGPIPADASAPEEATLEEVILNTFILEYFDRNSAEIFWFSQMLKDKPQMVDEFIALRTQEETGEEFSSLVPLVQELKPMADEFGLDFLVQQFFGFSLNSLPVWWYRDSRFASNTASGKTAKNSENIREQKVEFESSGIPGDKGLAVYDLESETFLPLKKKELVSTSAGWEWGIVSIKNAGKRLKSREKGIEDLETDGYFLKLEFIIKNVTGMEFVANYGTSPTLLISPNQDMMEAPMLPPIIYGQAYFSGREISIDATNEKSYLENDKSGVFTCLYAIPEEYASLKRLYALNSFSIIGFDIPR